MLRGRGAVTHNEMQGEYTMEHRLHVFKDKAIGIGRSTWLIIGIVISFRSTLVLSEYDKRRGGAERGKLKNLIYLLYQVFYRYFFMIIFISL